MSAHACLHVLLLPPGSGKTHSLIGAASPPEQRGLVPRAIAALAQGVGADSSGAQFMVRGYSVLWCAVVCCDI